MPQHLLLLLPKGHRVLEAGAGGALRRGARDGHHRLRRHDVLSQRAYGEDGGLVRMEMKAGRLVKMNAGRLVIPIPMAKRVLTSPGSDTRIDEVERELATG